MYIRYDSDAAQKCVISARFILQVSQAMHIKKKTDDKIFYFLWMNFPNA